MKAKDQKNWVSPQFGAKLSCRFTDFGNETDLWGEGARCGAAPALSQCWQWLCGCSCSLESPLMLSVSGLWLVVFLGSSFVFSHLVKQILAGEQGLSCPSGASGEGGMWEGAGWRSPCAGGAGIVPWVQQLCPAGASLCHCPGLVFAQSMAASRAVTLLSPSPFSHLFPQQILWELLFQPPYYPDILLHPPSSQLGLEVTIPAPPMVQGDPPSSSHG